MAKTDLATGPGPNSGIIRVIAAILTISAFYRMKKDKDDFMAKIDIQAGSNWAFGKKCRARGTIMVIKLQPILAFDRMKRSNIAPIDQFYRIWHY